MWPAAAASCMSASTRSRRVRSEANTDGKARMSSLTRKFKPAHELWRYPLGGQMIVGACSKKTPFSACQEGTACTAWVWCASTAMPKPTLMWYQRAECRMASAISITRCTGAPAIFAA